MGNESRRDNFSGSTIKLLHDKVNGLCSKPDCRILTRGPNSKVGKITSIGQAAHITAAAKGGPRYNASLSQAERKSYENGIWLCNNHARLIDSDKEKYPIELLKSWKLESEKHVEGSIGKPLFFKENTDILDRLREVSLTLQETGCANWKMPKFVAPLNLQLQVDEDKKLPQPTNITKLIESVNLGENLLLFGDGGIGKTTTLLELSGVLLETESSRIPLYIDAAKWARSTPDICEYIVRNPVAKRYGISVDDVLSAADAGKLTLAINGWNEITDSKKLSCLDNLGEYAISTPNLNFILTTRAASSAPNISFEKKVHILGLSWNNQSEIIRNTLDKDASDKLIDFLAQNTRLRHAARSPLIIQGLISQTKKGDVANSSIFDLLGAVVRDSEEDYQRQPHLQEHPLCDHQGRFLESLALHQSSHQETNSPRRETLPIISAVARQLTNDGYYGTQPEPSEILDTLCTHHLLHSDDSNIRFAHQRFQEYYTARALLHSLKDDTADDTSNLVKAINEPFFEDALRLVCDKIKRVESYKGARVLLVKTALGIDLGFACELAGYCLFDKTDDANLFDEMVPQVNTLLDSPLPKIAEYGLGCLASSRFKTLSPKLWSRLENDDQQKRLNTYRLLKSGITVEQLGNGADERIRSWSLERKIELIHELSRNAENYRFIVGQANEALESTVRAAAISELSWNFPASEATLKAWLNAPVEVKLANKVLSAVQYTIQQGDGSVELNDSLKALFRSHVEKRKKCKIALGFPQIIGLEAIEIVFERLKQTERGSDPRSLISIAETHTPEKLKKLAAELILSDRPVPEWAYEIVYQLPEDAQSEIFESAWEILHEEYPSKLTVSDLGPLASRDQILLCINEWLSNYRNREPSEREATAELRQLLWNVSREKLLSVIIELGPEAPYRDSAEMLDLLSTCIRRDSENEQNQNPWLPTKRSVTELIAIYRDKSVDNAIWQNEILDHLCSIASRVDPIEFSDLILDGFHEHHDSCVKHEEAFNKWNKDRSLPQPSIQIIGNFVESAQRGGFDILLGLLDLFDHGVAHDLIPSAISKIVSAPWLEKQNRTFPSVTSDFLDGEECRLKKSVLLQPSDDLQDLTDYAAEKLCAELTRLVNKLEIERKEAGADWNERLANYGIKPILSAVSHFPSPVIIKPLMSALRSGFVDPYGMMDALRSLIRHGAYIEEIAVIQNLEKMYTDKTQAEWLHHQERHLMWEICQILWAVEPSSLLSKPLIEYSQECIKYNYQSEIIQFLGDLPHASSWCCLVEIGKQLFAQSKIPDGFLHYLIKSLKHQNFEQFIGLIEDKTWFSWFPDLWDLKQVAPAVLQVIGEDQARLEMFLNACVQSDTPSSNGFACALLNSLPNRDSICIKYGLRFLDAGGIDNIDNPICTMLMGLFKLSVSLTDNGSHYCAYEVHPRSCNDLRLELYSRSKKTGNAAAVSRQLLAEIECQRRESGRPSDEPRHPELNDMVPWNSVLMQTD